jgi:hypothetical protein
MNMKKLIIILTAFFSLTTYSQVKISAMPFWSGSMDSAYVPIVVNLVNYKTLTSRINQTRIDSIVNNWPLSGGGIQSVEGQNGTVVVNDSIVKLGTNPLIEHTTINGASTYTLNITDGRFEQDLGANIAAANNLTLGLDGNSFTITGNTQINAITTSNWQAGSVVRLIFTGTPTLKHNTAGGAGTAVLLLAGAADYIAAANDVITLVYDGTSWHETSRKLSAVVTTAGRFSYPGEDQTTDQNRSFTWADKTWTHTWNTLVNSAVNITSTSTAVASGSAVIDISVSGALAASSVTNYGIHVSNTRTGTSIVNYGILAAATGASNVGVRGENDNTGAGVRGQNSSSGQGVIGQSSSGIGVWAITSTGTGIAINASSGLAINSAQSGMVTTNTSTQHATFATNSSTSPTTNFGSYFSYLLEQATGGSTAEAYREEWYWTDATTSAATSNYAIWTRNGGTLARKVDVTGAGNLEVLTAGKALVLTSPDATKWYITVDNSGVLSTSTTAP